jgi:nucleotide-binding universal stress UspA family protein
MGDPAQTLVDRSLLSDVIVMSLVGSKSRELANALSAVVTHADAPVLAMPAGASRLQLEKPIMVAWKPTKEAAQAVKRATGLLQQAGRVDVVTIDPAGAGDFPPTAVASYLARHGVKAELHERTSKGQSASDTLMGGYGRSRAMEYLMGGVTRRLLGASDIALLMAH